MSVHKQTVKLTAIIVALTTITAAGFSIRWNNALAALTAAGSSSGVEQRSVPLTIGTCDTAGPIEVESTGGTTTPTAYATLKDAFDAINAGTHQGSINVEVCGNTTETASASLEASGTGAALYTDVTVRPVGGARIIEGTITGAVIKLNGADNVTIDGRQGGTGTARDLTVRNNAAVTATAAIWLASVAAGNGASSNIIRNLEIAAGQTANTGTLTTIGIYMGGTTISLTATTGNDNDNNQFIFNRVTKARYGIATRGVTTNNNLNPVVTDNIIGPDSFGADEIGKVGIYMQADTGAVVSRNIVQYVGGDLANTTGGADRCGICIGGESWGQTESGTITSGDYTVTRNIVHDVIEERTFSAVGIRVGTTRGGSATNNLIANNFIYNVRANGTAGDQSCGIGYAAGHTDTIVFNSISMTGDVDPAGTTTSSIYGNGIRVSTVNGTNNVNLTLMNNSVYMDLSSNTATQHFYDITLPSAAYVFGTGGLNYNNYFYNAANTQLFTGGLGTTSGATPGTEFQTLANWQGALTTPQDANSIQADPLYFSTTGNLHIPTNSPNVNAATAIAGITTDIDGDTRPNGPASDIGADESLPSPGSLQLSASSYSVLETGGTATITATRAGGSNGAVSVDYATVAGGTATGGAACTPGIDYVTTSGTLNWADLDGAAKTFNITICADGVLEPGETVNIALSNVTGGATLGTPNTAVLDIGDAGTPITGSYDVGTGQTIPSLTNAGGMFDAINNGTVTGNVTINITSDLTGETGAVALNEFAAGFTLTIKPSLVARTISGSSTNSIIRLNGADSVIIDGSLTVGVAEGLGGTPALRNLTVHNTNPSATAGAVIAVMSGTNGAQNNAIRNINIHGQDPAQTLIGLHMGGNSVGSAGTDNDNNVVENCAFRRTFIGLYNAGANAANQNTSNLVTMNDMTGTGSDRLRRAGMLFFNHDGLQVTLNRIGGINADESIDAYGIGAGIQAFSTTITTSGAITNSVISRNEISGIANTTDFSAVGIGIAGGTTGPNTIANNMISGVIAPSTSPDLVAGIFVTGATSSDTRLYFNSVSMTGDRGALASQIGSYGIAITGTNPVVELKDNVFSNAQISGGGANAKSYSIGMVTTTFTNLNSNYNDFFATGANAGFFRTGGLGATATDHPDLLAWQTATSQDANSLAVDPLFVNPANDLHLQSTSTLINAGIAAGGITVDFDGQTRDATPDIGADEFTAPNTPPTITAAVGVARQEGSPGSNSTIATVTDTESGNGAVVVTVTSANPSNGVTISNIVNTNGTVTADVVAACGATNASFTLQASDGSLTATDTLNVTVTPNTAPTLTYANATVASGGSTNVNPATGPSDNGSVASIVVQSAGTYTGTISVDNVTGIVSISGAAPVGMHTITIRATDNCGTFTDASFTLDVQSAGGPVIVTATAGTPGPTNYPTLKDAIDAINAGTHQGDITVSIVTSTTETATSVLNSSGAGTALYTSVLIRPTSDGVTVAGPSAQGRGLIELNGADNVTIDGDNPNSGGTNRNLTLQNTAVNTTTFTSVVRVALNTTTVNSADNNIFRNLNIVGSSTGQNVSTSTGTTISANTTFGIFLGPNASGATTAPTAITSVLTGVGAGATAANLLVSNNSVVTAARGISINGSATTVNTGLQITNNTIGNATAGDPDQVTAIGITANGSTNAVISGNTVYVEGYIASSAAGHGINVGVNSVNTTGATIENNRVNRVRNNNGTTWSAFGINLGGGSSHIVRNNFVSGVMNDQTAGTGGFGTTFGAYGIRVASGTGHTVHYNSVHLYGPLAGTVSTNLTAAFLVVGTGQTGLDVRNNIFSNQVAGGNPAGSRNVAVYLPSGATSAMNLTLNNNAYFVASEPLSRLAQVGTVFGTGEYTVANFDPTTTTPASNFRAYTSTLSAAGTNDNASFALTGTPPFVSNTDLHVPDSTATPLESRATPVATTVDIDGQARNVTTPDIGADEFSGVFVTDFLPPSMSYTPFGNTAQTTNRTVSVTIVDASGVPTTGTLVPRIYFNKNGGAYSSTACTLTSGTGTNGTWDCTIDYSLVGGVTSGDVINYFVIAQDTATPINIGSNPGGATATDVNTVTAPPPSPNSYSIVTAVPTSVNVGTGETFTSLTNPGGIFAAINAGVLTGNTTVNITSDLTAETGAVMLNQFSEDGAGGYTLTIKPSGAPRTISGTPPASTALIALNGADRVIIDGSLGTGMLNGIGGNDRSLTITNNQTATTTVIWIRSASSSNGSNNNTIRNCIINGAPGPNSTTTAGILTGSGVTLGNDAEAPNNNNTIHNNWIYRVQNSMYLRGGAAANADLNWTVTGNELGSSVFNDNNIFRGMLIGNSQNFVVNGNVVHGVRSTSTTTAAMSGIQIALAVLNGTVTNNMIADIKNVSASGTGAHGISFISTSLNSNVTVANNFVSDVAANGSATINSNGHGIHVAGGSGYKLYHNSVNLNTNQASGTTAALNVTTGVTAAGALDVRNNILANTQTAGATRRSVHSAAAATVFGTINYNDYFSTGSVGFIGGTDRPTLADWQTGTGQDANSLAVDPMFVSPTDLHVLFSSPVINAGVAGTGITTDIDGQTRDATPDIGADEVLGNPGTLQFSSATYAVGESGGTATITVTRAGGTSGTVGVNYATSDSTATGGATCTAGIDYNPASGTLTFLDGENSKTFTVTICPDVTDEPDETVNLALSNPTGGAVLGSPNTAVLTITDDDAPPGTLSINDVRLFEGNSGSASMVFTVTYTGAAVPVSVQYATANGTAVAGIDYSAVSGTLNFNPPPVSAGGPPTQTQNVTVPINGDLFKEANETLFVNLSNPTGATISDGQGVGIIIDEDRPYVSDFDRDNITDVSVFRPSEARWYILQTTNAQPKLEYFGNSTDRPVPSDYDGDGKTDIAVWRDSSATWYVFNSSNGTVSIVNFGSSGDKPVQGDYDGDDNADIAVFRPSTATWWVRPSSTGVAYAVPFGLSTDLPVQGDYDGDLTTDIAVFRDGVWYMLRSTDGQVQIQTFGLAGDRPVSGDFDGDGKYDPAIVRGGDWWILNSLTGNARALVWGLSTDIPAPADFDGDGTTDIAVFRPSNGDWYILTSSNNTLLGLHWGLDGDIPVPTTYLPQ